MGPAILVRQMVWSSFGSYHLKGIIWFLFEKILGTIVLTGRVAAPGAPVNCHKDIISFVLFGIQGDCKVTVKRIAKEKTDTKWRKRCQAFPVFS
jgi:hypothetical protein